MPIQLKELPNIKITMRNGDVFSDYAPNYIYTYFKLTKKLLEPNCFEFHVRKDDLSLEDADFRFNLRDELLGAKVECSLVAYRYDEEKEEKVEDTVDNFFYGYIQNIKIVRKGIRNPLTFICTAYSPDARLKLFPSCRTFNDCTLQNCVEDILGIDANEETTPFSEGEYDDFEGLSMEVHPRFQQEMPYTVQYNESAYNFLKRLARRYGEFFYYEDGDVIFGDMIEKEMVVLDTSGDLEEFTFDLNMNHHTGIMFAQHNQDVDAYYFTNMEKYPEENTGDPLRESPVEPTHEMTRSAYEASTEFFNDSYNSVIELRSAPEIDKVVSQANPNTPKDDYYKELYKYQLRDEQTAARFMAENNWEEKTFASFKRDLLDQYVAADSMICTGIARRVDLKLGTVLSLIDTTETGSKKEDSYEYDPMKVIGLEYEWEKKHTLKLTNTFKAIPKDSPVPPYLERDQRGFLVYGDFDEYPISGPQHGVVIDNHDPEHIGRVKVSLLWQNAVGRSVDGDTYFKYSDKKNCTPWIWITNHYIGTTHGTHFVPERGDQVMVGFVHNNAERPYVIGSLGSRFSIAENAYQIDEFRNETKMIRTRSGHTIQFNDNIDGGGSVYIYDYPNQNYVIGLDIDDKLISLESKGNIELRADRNIVLHAGRNIVMTAEKNMETTVKNDATTYIGNDLDHRVNHDSKYIVNNVFKHSVIGSSYYFTQYLERHKAGSSIVLSNYHVTMSMGNHEEEDPNYFKLDMLGGKCGYIMMNMNRLHLNHVLCNKIEVTEDSEFVMQRDCVSIKNNLFGNKSISLTDSGIEISARNNIEMKSDMSVTVNGKVVKVN